MNARKDGIALAFLFGTWLAAVESHAAVAASRAARLPTATPTLANPAGATLPSAAQPGAGTSVMASFNTPEYSPKQIDFGQLDFGAIANGQASRRTFVLRTNGNGYVTVELPRGPFSVVEYREMGLGGQGFGGGGALEAPVRNVKSRITFPPGQSGPWRWRLTAGVEIQVDILFEPKLDRSSMGAGLRSATMRVTGPGPKGNWMFAVPLQGMCNGIRIALP